MKAMRLAAPFVILFATQSALPIGQPAFSQNTVRQLPRTTAQSQKVLQDGTRISRTEMPDGSTSEISDRRDGSREIVYNNADGSKVVITTEASGRTSAEYIDHNGHRRPMTPEGCDDRARLGVQTGLPQTKPTTQAPSTSQTKPAAPVPAASQTKATTPIPSGAQTGVQQFNR
jgi:hypothetical protein